MIIKIIFIFIQIVYFKIFKCIKINIQAIYFLYFKSFIIIRILFIYSHQIMVIATLKNIVVISQRFNNFSIIRRNSIYFFSKIINSISILSNFLTQSIKTISINIFQHFQIIRIIIL